MKKRKKNKALPLVILITLLFVVIAAYVLVVNLTSNDAESAETGDVGISLTAFSADKIAALEYTVDKDAVSLEFDGGVWKVKGDDKFPLDQTAVAKMTSAIAELTAKRTVNSGELADFGLDEAGIVITVTLNDGSKVSFSIGDKNSFNNLTYLLKGESVYMFNDTLSEPFGLTLDELMLIEDAIPDGITADSVISLTVKNAAGDSAVYDGTCDDLGSFITKLKSNFKFTSPAAYGLTEDEIGTYGINDSGASVIIKYKMNPSVSTGEASADSVEATFTIYCGDKDGDECYYTLKGSDMVYQVKKEDLKALFDYLIYEYSENKTADETE